MLKWSKANAKIESLANVAGVAQYLQNKRKVYSLDLLSGHSCPFANECLSKVKIIEGRRKVVDGPNTLFRCFSASQEVVYTATYDLRKHNFDSLRACNSSTGMLDLLVKSKPKNLGVCRIHVGGDMFNQKYFLAWAGMAELYPDILFYAYTKSLRYWLKFRDHFDSLPNFVLTASYGGRDDALIKSEGLRSSVVVFSEQEAADKGLEIDHDDSHAADPTKQNEDFALLIHGTQPKGSEASEALQLLRKNKVKHSYSKKRKAG